MPNAPRPQPRKPPAKQAQSSRPPSKPEKPDVGNLKARQATGQARCGEDEVLPVRQAA
jgi:hypothetical protein